MELEELWERYSDLLLSTFQDGEQANVKFMLDELGERIIMTPANRLIREAGCEPGGMLRLSMQVASQAVKLLETYDLQPELKRSVVKIALLHDLGKVGDLKHDHFIPQDSDWHREKLGAHYKFNDAESLQKMTVAHRTLYLLQHYGILITQNEWLAIQLAPGFHFEENRWYVHDEPSLARVIQHAKYAVSRREA